MTGTISVLKGWSQDGKLSEVSFGKDGALHLGDKNIRAEDNVQVVTNGDKTCHYTAGSIFLQLVDTNQSLLGYRKACKEHHVQDPVKASDKAAIIEFFLGSPSSTTAPSDPVAPTEPDTLPTNEGNNRDSERDRDRHERKKRHQSSSDKDRHRRSHSSKKRERSRSSSRQLSSDRKDKKPKAKSIDPEKLFSNLSLVVGRREIKAKRDAEQAKLHRALSTEGFGAVAPEIIAKYNNQEYMAHEIPVGNSSSILKAGAGKDLSRVLKLYNETVSKKSTNEAGKKKTSAEGKRTSDGQKKSWRSYLVGKKPIIVLPKGLTAPITLVNAHKFFGESKFVTREKMQKELRTMKRAPITEFSRHVNSRLGGGKVEYELMDNPKSKLYTAQDWDRVVAVVALGQPWQMKDWPGPYSNPVQLFHRVFGFYISMESDKVPAELQGWSVTRSKLNRDKRGLDSVTYAGFWNALDGWMAIHKPELLPQHPNS
jgi:parafibromin